MEEDFRYYKTSLDDVVLNDKEEKFYNFLKDYHLQVVKTNIYSNESRRIEKSIKCMFFENELKQIAKDILNFIDKN